MAKLVLAGWGIQSTNDFGEIVYNLIRIGKMSQSDAKKVADRVSEMAGTQQEAVTSDEYNNWFPHISPDGKWIALQFGFMKGAGDGQGIFLFDVEKYKKSKA